MYWHIYVISKLLSNMKKYSWSSIRGFTFLFETNVKQAFEHFGDENYSANQSIATSYVYYYTIKHQPLATDKLENSSSLKVKTFKRAIKPSKNFKTYKIVFVLFHSKIWFTPKTANHGIAQLIIMFTKINIVILIVNMYAKAGE